MVFLPSWQTRGHVHLCQQESRPSDHRIYGVGGPEGRREWSDLVILLPDLGEFVWNRVTKLLNLVRRVTKFSDFVTRFRTNSTRQNHWIWSLCLKEEPDYDDLLSFCAHKVDIVWPDLVSFWSQIQSNLVTGWRGRHCDLRPQRRRRIRHDSEETQSRAMDHSNGLYYRLLEVGLIL